VADDVHKYFFAKVARDNEVVDAAVASLLAPIGLVLSLSEPSVRPKPYVTPWNSMPVQTFGATSGYHKGHVSMTYGAPQGAFYYGSRGAIHVGNLGTKPGDSGALLVSGHGMQSAVSDALGLYSPAYVAAHVCAAIGMLALGPLGSGALMTPADSIFVPLSDIQLALDVRVCTEE
jgi:hypothetical protein